MMKKRNITCLAMLILLLTISLIPGEKVDAKTRKSIPDGPSGPSFLL